MSQWQLSREKSFTCFVWGCINFIQHQSQRKKLEKHQTEHSAQMCVYMKSERTVVVSCSTFLFGYMTHAPGRLVQIWKIQSINNKNPNPDHCLNNILHVLH